MKPITVWRRFNPKTQEFEHNHIQDGHVDGDIPHGTRKQNAIWHRAKWQKVFGYLDANHKVIIK